MMRARALGAVAAAFAIAAPAFAQTRVDAQAGAEYRSVNFGAGQGYSSLKEFAGPIGFSMPVGPRLRLDGGTDYVSAPRPDPTGPPTTQAPPPPRAPGPLPPRPHRG